MATTISYSLLPIPRWYFADLTGKPLGGGFMQAWSSLDPTSPKTVFQDSGGVNAWPTINYQPPGSSVIFPNAIMFGANGEQGPFFWEFDTSDPDDLYFLQFYDAQGKPQFSINNYGGPGGAGGGGIITTNNFLKNYVVNNVFWRNGTTANNGTFTNVQSGTVLAPSSHCDMQFPDIQFIRSNNSATDTITFLPFLDGQVPLNGDVTPQYYMSAHCTVAGTESSKVIRFPIDLHVKNLEQQTMTAIIWAKTGPAGGNQNFSLQINQSFGIGSPTSDVITTWTIGTQSATGIWTAFTATIPIPPINDGTQTIGAGGDDATYLEIALTAGGSGVGEILFAKPKLYLGTLSLFSELDTYDQVDSIINMPRPGDIQVSLRNTTINGWLLMNDTSIGSRASPAAYNNISTWQLYNLIWNTVGATNAPMVDGNPYGVSAIADFSNNRALYLTKALGRALAGAGTASGGGITNWTLGQAGGNETHTLTLGEIPNHTHDPGTGGTFVGDSGSALNTGNTPALSRKNTTGTITGYPGSTALSLVQATSFMNVFIKL